jgi:hypothetical protein
MQIPEKYLEELRAARLLVSKPFVPGHVAFPDGVTVGKPKGAGGHSLLDFECYWDPEIPLDAPTLFLHSSDGTWYATSHDFVPGPGPGDFVNTWATPEEAVADILDFYFGDASRMETKRRVRAR